MTNFDYIKSKRATNKQIRAQQLRRQRERYI